MANISKRRKGELIRMLFQILKAQSERMRASEALELLAKQATLTEYEEGNYETGRHCFDKVLFSAVVPVKVGWLVA